MSGELRFNNTTDSVIAYIDNAGTFHSASHEFRPDGTRWKFPQSDWHDPLATLMRINVHRYTLPSGVSNRTRLGYFAEELNEISPSLSDGRGVDGVTMSALNTLGIQALTARIAALEKHDTHTLIHD